jgi:non-ribosomal peptide synthetase component E (peptide arylation enzyme)
MCRFFDRFVEPGRFSREQSESACMHARAITSAAFDRAGIDTAVCHYARPQRGRGTGEVMRMKTQTYVSEQCARRYRSAGWWKGRTLLDDFDAAVASRPLAAAVVGPDGRRMSFAELDEESRRVAAHFVALGLDKGDVVAVQLPNWIEFVTVHLAATRLGAVTTPLLPSYREHELSYILRFSRTSIAVIPGHYRAFDFPAMYAGLWRELPDLNQVVVVNGEAPPPMRPYAEFSASQPATLPACEVRGDEVSALIFTSGTESTPKAVMHSHDTMMYGTRTMPKLLGLTYDDVVWAPAPLGHATGFLWGMRLALALGCKLVLQDIWDPEDALRLIEAERCTFTLAATPFVKMLLDSSSAGQRDTSSLRFFGCAGAPIPRNLGLEVEERLGCRLVGMWGMSECFVGSASLATDPEHKHWGTDGRAMPGSELAVFDETRTRMLPPGDVGELATRGPHVALGYFNDPERTAQAFSPEGWLFTGDLATVDAEGYMRIVGRTKDIINRGGLKISAREVEDLLLQHPLVKEAVVVGVPDARLGEKSCAFIVPDSPRHPKLAQLVQFLEERGIAKYKLPEFLVVLTHFPMTPSGKIQRFALLEAVVNGGCVVETA